MLQEVGPEKEVPLILLSGDIRESKKKKQKTMDAARLLATSRGPLGSGVDQF